MTTHVVLFRSKRPNSPFTYYRGPMKHSDAAEVASLAARQNIDCEFYIAKLEDKVVGEVVVKVERVE